MAVGPDADIVLFDPDETWTIGAAEQHSRIDYSLFEGRWHRRAWSRRCGRVPESPTTMGSAVFAGVLPLETALATRDRDGIAGGPQDIGGQILDRTEYSVMQQVRTSGAKIGG